MLGFKFPYLRCSLNGIVYFVKTGLLLEMQTTSKTTTGTADANRFSEIPSVFPSTGFFDLLCESHSHQLFSLSQSMINPTEYLLLMGHWILRYDHWFSWTLKYRLLRVRYWITEKRDDPYFLYRPSVAGWGWGAWYAYWTGGGGGGSNSAPTSAPIDYDKDFAGSDSSIISSPLEEADVEAPPYDFSTDQYHPDEINNDLIVTMKPYNYYNASDPNYYPAPSEEALYSKPVFGQPVRGEPVPPPTAESVGQTLFESPITNNGMHSQKHGRKRKQHPVLLPSTDGNSSNSTALEVQLSSNFTYSDLEEKAQAALLQMQTQKQSQQLPQPQGDVHDTSQEKARVAELKVIDPMNALKVKPRTQAELEKITQDSQTHVQSTAAVEHDMYAKLSRFRITPSENEDFDLLPKDKNEIREEIEQVHKLDKGVTDHFTSPSNPVNDRVADYVADADEKEQEWASQLSREYRRMENVKPPEFDNGPGWDFFESLIHTGMALIDPKAGVSETNLETLDSQLLAASDTADESDDDVDRTEEIFDVINTSSELDGTNSVNTPIVAISAENFKVITLVNITTEASSEPNITTNKDPGNSTIEAHPFLNEAIIAAVVEVPNAEASTVLKLTENTTANMTTLVVPVASTMMN
jgi:hypothetical protein